MHDGPRRRVVCRDHAGVAGRVEILERGCVEAASGPPDFNGGGSHSWFGGRGPSNRAGVSAEWGGSPRGRGLLRGVGNRRLFAGFPRGCGGRHPFAGIQAGVGGGSPEGRLRGDRRPHPRQPRHRQQATSRLNPRPLLWRWTGGGDSAPETPVAGSGWRVRVGTPAPHEGTRAPGSERISRRVVRPRPHEVVGSSCLRTGGWWRGRRVGRLWRWLLPRMGRGSSSG